MAKTMGIDNAIGQRLLSIRERVPRELVVHVARQWGFPWSANTLALIETGRRRLTLGEFLILPHVLTRVFGGIKDPGDNHLRPFVYSDLFPDGNDPLAMTATLVAPALDGVRALIEKQGVMSGQEDLFDRPRNQDLQAFDETTLRAANALNVPMRTVIDVARQKWGRLFIEERDRRIDEIKERIGSATAISARRLQAMRGHVTREMLGELRPILLKSSAKKRRRKERG